jgi:hypothetical protein
MSAPVSITLQWQWPPDGLAFAAQHHVQDYLDPLLEATRRIFPNACRQRVVVDEDPEIRDYRHLDFDVQIPQVDSRDYLQLQHRWTDDLYRLCPAPQTVVFRLLLDMSPA